MEAAAEEETLASLAEILDFLEEESPHRLHPFLLTLTRRHCSDIVAPLERAVQDCGSPWSGGRWTSSWRLDRELDDLLARTDWENASECQPQGDGLSLLDLQALLNAVAARTARQEGDQKRLAETARKIRTSVAHEEARRRAQEGTRSGAKRHVSLDEHQAREVSHALVLQLGRLLYGHAGVVLALAKHPDVSRQLVQALTATNEKRDRARKEEGVDTEPATETTE